MRRLPFACVAAVFYVTGVLAPTASAQEPGPASIALGTDFGCGLTAAGQVRCWGSSRDGQCGVQQDGTPVRAIEGLPASVEEVATGYSFACARSGGDVWCWGDNGYGQLGVDGPEERETAAQHPGLSDVAELALGNFNGCARKDNGEVWCWGLGRYGQLGPDVEQASTTPVKINGLPPATRIFGGDHHFCTMDARDRLYCWGQNEYGQAGSNRRQRRARPRRIRNTGAIAEVALGASMSCIRNTDGRVRCWGNNLATIGEGGLLRRPTLHPHPALRDVQSIALSNENMCAVAGGQVFCQGVNRQGELHVPTPEMGGVVLVPTAAPGITDAVEVRVRARVQCARRQSGQWLCWGYNRSGSDNAVGVGARGRHVESPTALPWN